MFKDWKFVFLSVSSIVIRFIPISSLWNASSVITCVTAPTKPFTHVPLKNAASYPQNHNNLLPKDFPLIKSTVDSFTLLRVK